MCTCKCTYITSKHIYTQAGIHTTCTYTEFTVAIDTSLAPPTSSCAVYSSKLSFFFSNPTQENSFTAHNSDPRKYLANRHLENRRAMGFLDSLPPTQGSTPPLKLGIASKFAQCFTARIYLLGNFHVFGSACGRCWVW